MNVRNYSVITVILKYDVGDNVVVVAITNHEGGFDCESIVRDWYSKGLNESADLISAIPVVAEFSNEDTTGGKWYLSC